MNTHYPYHQNQSKKNNTSGGSSQGKVWGFSAFSHYLQASGPEYQIWRLTGSEASGLKVFILSLQPSPGAWWKQRVFFIKVSSQVAQRTTKMVAFSSLTIQKLYKAQFICVTRGCFSTKTPSWFMPAPPCGFWEMKGNVAENNGR